MRGDEARLQQYSMQEWEPVAAQTARKLQPAFFHRDVTIPEQSQISDINLIPMGSKLILYADDILLYRTVATTEEDYTVPQ